MKMRKYLAKSYDESADVYQKIAIAQTARCEGYTDMVCNFVTDICSSGEIENRIAYYLIYKTTQSWE